jgi:RNA polymerase sigma-70 factor (ECF subfamily)
MDQIIPLTERIPEEVLIKRITSGEKGLFEHIMRSYNQRLYRIGMSILNNDMEAEDAMQNAYISAYEHLDKFEERSSFGTWLTRIMLNECLAQKKRKLKKMEFERQPGEHINTITPAEIMANKELNSILENAVGQLPEKYRLVFVLREIEEMSVKETSQVLNIEEPNVKVRLNRAKTMLKESLSGYMKENVYSFHLSRCDRVVANVLAHFQISV